VARRRQRVAGLGITNSDAARLDEFLEHYENQPLTSTQGGAMGRLLLASANERLESEPAANLDGVARVLPRIVADAPWEHDYWRGLDGSPLADWLRQRGDCRFSPADSYAFVAGFPSCLEATAWSGLGSPARSAAAAGP
jgi:hypothetical protein